MVRHSLAGSFRELIVLLRQLDTSLQWKFILGIYEI